MKFEFEDAVCAVCSETDSVPYREVTRFSEGPLNYVRCNECGLIYQNPRPTQRTLIEFFSSESFNSAKDADRQDGEIAGYYDYVGEEAFRLKLAAARLRHISRHFPANRKLRFLKIACGTGTFLKVAQDRGHQVLGVDVSDTFVKVATERYRVPMIHGTFEDADLGDQKFDAILLFGAINNLIGIRQLFDKARAHLADDGVFVFNYIDIENTLARLQKQRFWLFRPPAVYQFTRPQVREMLSRLGWELIEHRRDSQYTSVAKLTGFLGWRYLWNIVEKFNLHYKVVKIPIPGGYSCVAKPDRAQRANTPG